MADTNKATTSAADIQALLAQLAEAQANASPEVKLEVNQGLVSMTANLSQDERNKARQAERDAELATKNAKATAVHLALSKWMRDIGDEVSILVRFSRHKDATTGAWVWNLQGVSGENGERWLPDGRSLIFSYESPNGIVHYPNYIATDAKHPRGTKLACEALLHGLDIWKEGGKVGSTASTKLKTELDKTDSDGNPGGLSDFRHKLDKVLITHEDINGGKPMRLTAYWMSLLAPDEEEDAD